MATYADPKQVVGQSEPYNTTHQGYPGYEIKYTYADGSVETRFYFEGDTPSDAHPGVVIGRGQDRDQTNRWLEDQKPKEPKEPPQRAPQTPEETERDRQIVEEGRRKSAASDREEEERQWNATHPDSKGRAFRETHADRAARELREQADERAEEARDQSQRAERRQADTAARNAEIAAGQLEVSRGNLDIEREREARAARKPEFLSQSNGNNRYLIRYNPETGQVESMNDPNFDEVKQESERLRSLLAVQIQAKNATLDEAKQQYTQWYDTNVKTPMLLAQDARDRAAEQRQALDAEERRRQFAANFGLQKAELGQRAGAAAMQAEQSLLPYRAGPTESAEMSAAINSLGAGGRMDTNAAAGIHFTPGAFEFDAPDFKAIAKRAAADAIKGISSYKPSGEKYATADYSNVPAVNTSGAPSVPSGYGDFQSIIDQLQSTYNFGGPKG